MKRFAFSLIELLVVVGIMITLTGVSLVGYSRFQERQLVNRAAADLAGDLRLTQQKAISGEKPAVPSGCVVGVNCWCTLAGQSLTGWQLRFTGAAAYNVEGLCSNGATTVGKSVAITGATSGSQPTIVFSTLQGSTASTTVVFNGTSAGAIGYSKTVTVSTSGSVSVQ